MLPLCWSSNGFLVLILHMESIGLPHQALEVSLLKLPGWNFFLFIDCAGRGRLLGACLARFHFSFFIFYSCTFGISKACVLRLPYSFYDKVISMSLICIIIGSRYMA